MTNAIARRRIARRLIRRQGAGVRVDSSPRVFVMLAAAAAANDAAAQCLGRAKPAVLQHEGGTMR